MQLENGEALLFLGSTRPFCPMSCLLVLSCLMCWRKSSDQWAVEEWVVNFNFIEWELSSFVLQSHQDGMNTKSSMDALSRLVPWVGRRTWELIQIVKTQQNQRQVMGSGPQKPEDQRILSQELVKAGQVRKWEWKGEGWPWTSDNAELVWGATFPLFLRWKGSKIRVSGHVLLADLSRADQDLKWYKPIDVKEKKYDIDSPLEVDGSMHAQVTQSNNTTHFV